MIDVPDDDMPDVNGERVEPNDQMDLDELFGLPDDLSGARLDGPLPMQVPCSGT